METSVRVYPRLRYELKYSASVYLGLKGLDYNTLQYIYKDWIENYARFYDDPILRIGLFVNRSST